MIDAVFPRFLGALRAMALLAIALPAAAQGSGSVRVRLREPPEGGQVRMVLFDSDFTFGRFSDPIRVDMRPSGQLEYVMRDLDPGTYALVLHHDEDSDGTFDKNFIGIPRDPIAISRGYRPKGPPVYSRASFVLALDEELTFDLVLEPVLGKRGRFSVGAGVLGRSSPYVGGDTGVFQPIPAITFNGERLQWFGPTLRYGLLGRDRLRLAATASYRLRPYDEGDSAALAGLGDRKDTLLAGLAVVGELPAGINVSLGYEHDVLDQIGGGTARVEANRSFQLGVARLSPNVRLNWTSSKLADHDFGVSAGGAAPGRPAYDVGDVLTFEAGLGSFIELDRNWRLVLNASVEFLPDEVTDSPIVSDGEVIKGFAALTYAF